MHSFPEINLSEYDYHLPENLIAQKPAGKRDQSRLLVYNAGEIMHKGFTEVGQLLPDKATLFFNDARVIPARIPFKRATGARIELFLLQPLSSGGEIEQVMKSVDTCEWECMIGNMKRWKNDEHVFFDSPSDNDELQAELLDRDKKYIRLTWSSGRSFSEILEDAGKIPLPPYMHREADESDEERYQTVYAANEGAVAAPTAGLHFTPEILQELQLKGHSLEYLTLHVGAGTFQPISTEDVSAHVMHNERMVVTRQNVESLLDSRKRVAVGTTSVRTMESLYWYGVKLNKDPQAPFFVSKEDAYKLPALSVDESLNSVLAHMEKNGLNQVQGSTEIFIVPGYRFHLVDALITNFHLPGSTLILLIAAFIGSDWKTIYNEAIERSYRFLSYGDSSLLIPSQLQASS